MSTERRDPWSVGNWMTANPADVAPGMSARAAFIKMRSGGFRHLLVIDGEQLVGVVTDRDLRRPEISSDPEGWNDYYQLDDEVLVRDVMTDDPLIVHPRETLEKAVATMVGKKIGALPVVDKNEAVIGIFTTEDALRALAEALEVLRPHGDAGA